MRTSRRIGLAAALLVVASVHAQWLTTGNPVATGDYLGANASSVAPLLLKTVANQPIDFSTANLLRARLSAKVLSPMGPGDPFPNVNRDGFLLLSGQPDAFVNPSSRAPFTRLHLIDDATGITNLLVYAQEHGFRPWQRNGITFSGNSDQSYIGHKYGENDNTDYVIQWSDNPHGSPWGTDRLKILFTTQYSAGTTKGAASMDGLEAMRFWPRSNTEVNVGIGNFAPSGVGDPTERVDMLDGRLRIRQLPTDPVASSLTKFLVVDNAGVVNWRNLQVCDSAQCEEGHNRLRSA